MVNGNATNTETLELVCQSQAKPGPSRSDSGPEPSGAREEERDGLPDPASASRVYLAEPLPLSEPQCFHPLHGDQQFTSCLYLLTFL